MPGEVTHHVVSPGEIQGFRPFIMRCFQWLFLDEWFDARAVPFLCRA